MFAEAMRTTLKESQESLKKITERSGLTYSRVHDFKAGKRDVNSKSLSKIFNSLSDQDAENFLRILAQKKGCETVTYFLPITRHILRIVHIIR
ncbi:hypothetical protein AFK68_29670 [Hydrocoleum sp. CS-953]|uniref:hypothetical protein n=1 Tax=Hydrocoleum sp. CS-953 TaxID=1671698 RepID=UPI000B9BEDBB|nr:hypothetical protein [Hydrocoleum sp. CS-953]OZH51626.1 hypothetical protein AFK68_29670 [Hydrocoleum sp. CS-953]